MKPPLIYHEIWRSFAGGGELFGLYRSSSSYWIDMAPTGRLSYSSCSRGEGRGRRIRAVSTCSGQYASGALRDPV